jgi:RNA polymerase sigma-70 factor (ECF subfamily)
MRIELERDRQKELFACVVTEHSHAMFRAARAVLDSDTDAQDAVGEAILRAWQSWGSLRKREAARAWLLRITVNCAYEQRRKAGRTVPLDECEGALGGAEDRHYVDLWDAVLALPEEQRSAVTLFYYEDLTLAQIAKILGVAQGTVKSRLSRARGRLRELLREEEPI